jgi:hypothetical protein
VSDGRGVSSGSLGVLSSSPPKHGSDIDVLSAQVIRYDFVVNGSGSAFTLNYEPDDRSHLTGVGLVE